MATRMPVLLLSALREGDKLRLWRKSHGRANVVVISASGQQVTVFFPSDGQATISQDDLTDGKSKIWLIVESLIPA